MPSVSLAGLEHFAECLQQLSETEKKHIASAVTVP